VSMSAFSESSILPRHELWPKSVIERYEREEIDSVYLVFNEFKSVIAQRLIVEQILPIEEWARRLSAFPKR